MTGEILSSGRALFNPGFAVSTRTAAEFIVDFVVADGRLVAYGHAVDMQYLRQTALPLAESTFFEPTKS